MFPCYFPGKTGWRHPGLVPRRTSTSKVQSPHSLPSELVHVARHGASLPLPGRQHTDIHTHTHTLVHRYTHSHLLMHRYTHATDTHMHRYKHSHLLMHRYTHATHTHAQIHTCYTCTHMHAERERGYGIVALTSCLTLVMKLNLASVSSSAQWG